MQENIVPLKKLQPLILSLTSAFLLYAAWPTSRFTFLIFFAFVPLLLIEREATKGIKFFFYCFLTLLLWNAATTWWIGNTTAPSSGIVAIVLNSLFMCTPWFFFHKTRLRFGFRIGYIALITYWLTWEWIHLQWELSWPWLTLGNVFATQTTWVQWYEWTGTSGGTLWVLIVNILCINWFSFYRENDDRILLFKKSAVIFGVLTLPIVISLLIKPRDLNAKYAFNTVVVQPNIDAYTEKFTAGTQETQLQKLLILSEKAIDTNTELVVWPETSIPYQLNEKEITTNQFLSPIKLFLSRHPQLRLMSGADTYQFVEGKTKAAKQIPNSNEWYENYNTGLMLDSNLQGPIYHKGKLVPGAEIMPYVWLFGFLEKLALDLGGTSGTLGTGPERLVFKHNSQAFAPVICYESIYGEYVAEYVRNGATALVIMTNDGWWGNTVGHLQHASYACLRAIETRRFIARSANTGISCFIDPAGNIIDPQPWDKQAAIKMNMPPMTNITLFVRFGDLISKAAIALTFMFFFWSIYVRVKTKWFK